MLEIKFSQNIGAIILFAFLSLAAFYPFFTQGKIPVPGDVILAGYYPWQEIKWNNLQTIFPVLNPTISDSVTSFYPWREKSIEMVKQGKFPLFDNSSYMGSPLFSTGTTGLLYPFNIVFFIVPFSIGWGLQVAIIPFLAATFFYIWLKGKGLNYWAVILGSICYAFSGFIALQFSFVNSPHAVLWLPLILFCIDKLLNKFSLIYFLIFIFSLFNSLNAGFFQGSLYITGFAFLYLLYNLFSKHVFDKKIIFYFLPFIFAILLSAIQIIPFLETTSQSSRVSNYGTEATSSEIFDFFIQPKYLLTTIIPDFFGNPGKKNYFGEPNYYEFNNFSGSIVIVGILLLLTAFKYNKKLIFYWIILLLSLFIVIPNPVSQFPYIHSWPIWSSLTPSRMLLITQFCLIILAVYGLDLLFEKKLRTRSVLFTLVIIPILSAGILISEYYAKLNSYILAETIMDWSVTLRNSILSLGFLNLVGLITVSYSIFKRKFLVILLIIVTCIELIRQTGYFRPFIRSDLLYPNTQTISLLQENSNGYRFMITDPRLFPSNLQSVYGLEAIDGVSPLFSDRYNQFIFSIDSKNIGTELPRFRRTVFFTNSSSPLISMLNIKHVLSLEEIKDSDLKLISKDNSVYLYENTKVLPKVWIAKDVAVNPDPVETIKTIKQPNYNFKNSAIIPHALPNANYSTEPSSIKNLSYNDGEINFESDGDGIAVVSMEYLPGWKAYIDGKSTEVFPVNYGLMGIDLPKGIHQIKLVYSPDSIKSGLIMTGVTLLLLLLFTLFIFFKKNKISHRYN